MSKRLKELNREISALRKHFLPDTFDPLGRYADATRVQAHTRAFLVLSHAEIESYLEAWAKELARASENVWNSSQRITLPLAFLAATLGDRIILPDTLQVRSTRDGPQRFADATRNLYQKYYKRIKDNNGIKEKNILALFGPLGIPASALGSTLLPNLDSLGILRGAHAHQSAKAVPSVLDPETENNRVAALLIDLAVLDTWLATYRRSIR